MQHSMDDTAAQQTASMVEGSPVRVLVYVAVVLCLLLAALPAIEPLGTPNAPAVSEGELDLTEWDFGSKPSIELKGDWGFYWQQVVDPQAVSPAATGEAYIRVPGHWAQIAGAGTHGFASYVADLILPASAPPLMLKMTEVGTASAVYVNGVLVHESGRFGTTGQTSVPGIQRDLIRVLAVDENRHLRIVIHVSNFDYRTGGIWDPPVLGTVEKIQQQQDVRLAYAIFLASGICVIGLYQIGLYSLRREDISPLYFAAFCIGIVLRILSTDERFLTLLVPDISYVALVRIEYLSFLLATPAFGMFLVEILRGKFPVWMRFAGILPGLLGSLAIVFTQPVVFSEWLPFFQAYLVFGCLCCIYLLIRAIFNQMWVAWGFLISFLALLVAVFNDILVSVGLVQTPVILVSTGLFFFIVVQTYVLSMRSSLALRSVELLRFQLEAHSNQLEAEVAERTRDLATANAALEKLTVEDSLTQIANRRQFDQTLAREWASHHRRQEALSLILCDIDYFKKYNDRFGHVRGDEALQQVALCLRDCLSRPNDLVARYGGEEFVVLLPDTPSEGARELAERLLGAVRELRISHPDSPEGIVTLSMGVTTIIPDARTSRAQLVERADELLYRAKSEGRNRYIAD
ncbi:MAG: diguanylate cyclase [Pseudomonadales bacterium]|nr:diguanylate cyclase [Pseudomonadales bacterium]